MLFIRVNDSTESLGTIEPFRPREEVVVIEVIVAVVVEVVGVGVEEVSCSANFLFDVGVIGGLVVVVFFFVLPEVVAPSVLLFPSLYKSSLELSFIVGDWSGDGF